MDTFLSATLKVGLCLYPKCYVRLKKASHEETLELIYESHQQPRREKSRALTPEVNAKIQNKLGKLYCLSLASPPAWSNAYMGGHNLLKYSTLTAFKCSLLWVVSWAIHWKQWTRLEEDINTSLFFQPIGYEEKGLMTLAPDRQGKRMNKISNTPALTPD